MFKKFFLFFYVLVMFSMYGLSHAQGCGPFCPVCSGSGGSTGALVSPGTLVTNLLYIPNGEEETGLINFRGGIFPWLDLGIGYTVITDKPIWSARLQLLSEVESGWRPALMVGTGSVRTGGSDQSLYFQLTKGWEFSEIFSLRISAGMASLLPDLDKNYGLAGLTFTITDRWSPFISYDGIHFHPGLSWIPTDWLMLNFIMIESQEPAVSVGFRFRFFEESE